MTESAAGSIHMQHPPDPDRAMRKADPWEF